MDELNNKHDKLISIQDAIDAVYLQSDDDGWWCGTAEDMEKLLKGLPPAQPELIEKTAYIRGFEQGRTQGMIDSQGGKK